MINSIIRQYIEKCPSLDNTQKNVCQENQPYNMKNNKATAYVTNTYIYIYRPILYHD
jgi:hypothetical protein